MAVTVRLPGALRDSVGGENKVTASGRTLDEVFADIERRHPGFRSRVVDDEGRLRTYVNVYIGDADARAIGGLAAQVPADAEVMVIPAMAGGATAAAERVAIPAAIAEAVVRHAREQGTLECCGLIPARGGVPTRTIRCANSATAPAVRYRIDPREQLAAFRSMDAAGEELFGIYHSHPASVPFPSPTDRMEAYYPEAVYVLVSLRSGAPELRAFRSAADAPGSEKAVREL
ncbi:MAG: Mov34/MPN/PAD-1 family protein, partial [Chloroflexi bacterium]|nr:Mov34/MPN/PAD-1 family protein [Chloroflexota bacterium]